MSALKGLLVLLLIPAFCSASGTTPGFDQLLKESGMRYQAPDGYSELPLEYSAFGYEKRLGHNKQAIEVRYSIRPLNRISVDYEDPHNAAPHPNDLFDMLFRSVVEELSDGPDSISQAYPPEQAGTLFNAGWAAASVMDINPGISKEYRQGLLLAMHRNDRADAYILFLTNDLEAHKPYVDRLMASLQFVDEAGKGTLQTQGDGTAEATVSQ